MRKQLVFAQFGAGARRIGGLVLGLLICTLGPGLCARAQQGTFTTFDAPGAGTGSGQGTFAFAINPAGVITGYYTDASDGSHGFLRAPDGTFTMFDAPGSTIIGAFPVSPSSINPAGAVTGFYCDAMSNCHGFLRAPDGTFTTFDAPGAANPFLGTTGVGINPAGVITGNYLDANAVLHGFVRAVDGTFSTFDAPGAGTGFFEQGTSPVGINPQGTVSGCYEDANFVTHGFVRAKDGALTTFDIPNGTRVGLNCLNGFNAAVGPGFGINPAGAITGNHFQPISGNPFGGNFRGFLRAKDGSFATFDAATYPPCCIWTFGIAINPAGVIVGFLNDGFSVNHGFLRSSDEGAITLLDALGAGTGNFQGTIADGINPAGRITGYYIDASGANHGFLWIPCGEGDQGCQGQNPTGVSK